MSNFSANFSIYSSLSQRKRVPLLPLSPATRSQTMIRLLLLSPATHSQTLPSSSRNSHYHDPYAPSSIVPRNLLSSRNIYQWHHFVKRSLRPRKLDNHLTEVCLKLEEPNYSKWVNEDNILYTWLLDSMKQELTDQFMYDNPVKDIWELVNPPFS